MRIVYITAGAGRMICGSCLRDGALAAELRRQGHDVLLLPLYTPLHTESEDRANSRVFYGGVNVFLQQKIPLFRRLPRFADRIFDAPGLLRLVSRYSHMTAARDLAELTVSVLQGEHGPQRKELHRLADWLAGNAEPDVVLLPNTLLAGLAPTLRQRLGVPVLSFLSGEDAFIEEFPERLRENTLRALRQAARGPDGFIASSRYYADHMSRYLDQPPERFQVVPLGIDCSDYPEPRPAQPPRFTVGFLTRVCPAKGLDLLVQAVLEVRKRNPQSRVQLMAAGYLGPEYRDYLRRSWQPVDEYLRGNPSASEDFRFLGALDRAGKVGFLQGLSVFSVPSLYPESKARYVPEALAASAPVVLPRLGCCTEWVEGTGGGVLVEPDSVSALADALEDLMLHPEKARRLGDAGRTAVLERHTIATMARALVQRLQERLEDTGATAGN